MEDAFTLIVLTLLQLCRAEISNTEWFAANLINDPNYTPKPITEIFTTDITFLPKTTSTSTQTASRETPPPTIPTIFSTVTETKEIAGRNIVTDEVLEFVNPAIMQSQGNTPLNNNVQNAVLMYDPKLRNSPINLQPLSTPATSQAELSSTFVTQMSSIPSSPPSPSNLIPASQGSTIVIQQPQSQNANPSLIPIGLIPSTQFGNSFNPISNIPVVNASSALVSPIPVIPNVQSDTVQPENRRPSLTVRVKTPRGSITNIRINPSTTVRPLTTRRRKSSKRANDYEICLNSCNGRKEPICSSPIGVFPIDSDRLKGFASLCHMACHNSFRQDQVFEKVVDGRCGRLRTRIRPLDKNKLSREDLKQAQYTITHNAPETVMEFSPLKR